MMKASDWLELVKENKGDLENLLHNYHPTNRMKYRKNRLDLQITAPNAEQARNAVSRVIEREHQEDPVEKFRQALKDRKWRQIYNLLSEAWFGVPESVQCWNIRGFSMAVNLIEDSPYDVSE